MLVPAFGAAAASSVITNGDFETDAVDATTITGWTSMNQLIDLGATSIAGCTTQDTSDYTTLRGWADNAGTDIGTVDVDGDGVVLHPDTGIAIWVDSSGASVAPDTGGAWPLYYGEFTDADNDTYTWFYVVSNGVSFDASSNTESLDGNTGAIAEYVNNEVIPLFSSAEDPSVAADNVPNDPTDPYWGGAPSFATSITDESYDNGAGEYVPLEGKALRLFSNMDADDGGYVAHGPAVYSDAFTVTQPRAISLEWMAAAISDDYHVLGYVVNVSTCQQTEVIDSTGAAQAWTTASVNLTTPGDYRFVFVAGSYDQSWGGAAGAELLIDNIRSTPVIIGTGLDLDLNLDLGAPVSGATVQLTGGGLKAGSEWTAVMRSTPVVIASGVADSNGNFFQLGTLPSGVTPGQHSITLTGVKPDGSPITDVAYITVAANGTLSYLSFDGAEGSGAQNRLASTGVDAPSLAAGAGLLVLAGLTFAAVATIRRRRAA